MASQADNGNPTSKSHPDIILNNILMHYMIIQNVMLIYVLLFTNVRSNFAFGIFHEGIFDNGTTGLILI